MGHYLEVIHTSLKYPIVFFDHQFSKGDDVKLHFHEEIEIIYVLSGCLEVTALKKQHLLNEGDFYIINSRELHQVKFISENVHLYTFLLSMRVFEAFQIDQQTLYFTSSANKTRKEVFSCFKDFKQFSAIQKHLAMYAIYDWLLTNCLSASPKQNNRTVIDDVIDYINQHYDKKLQIADIAAVFHFHPNYLSRLFKEKTSMSLHQYLQRIRINHASVDVLYTDDSMLEICYRHGFNNLKSFHLIFKEVYGCSPYQYRKLKNDH